MESMYNKNSYKPIKDLKITKTDRYADLIDKMYPNMSNRDKFNLVSSLVASNGGNIVDPGIPLGPDISATLNWVISGTKVCLTPSNYTGASRIINLNGVTTPINPDYANFSIGIKHQFTGGNWSFFLFSEGSGNLGIFQMAGTGWITGTLIYNGGAQPSAMVLFGVSDTTIVIWTVGSAGTPINLRYTFVPLIAMTNGIANLYVNCISGVTQIKITNESDQTILEWTTIVISPHFNYLNSFNYQNNLLGNPSAVVFTIQPCINT